MALLPGVSGGNSARATRASTACHNTVNITIDGVNTGNMLQSTDGFFRWYASHGRVEEITVTARPGAGAGAGSVQVAMTTRAARTVRR